MQSLKTGANNGLSAAGGYQSWFARLGLDTGPVTRLQSNYHWAQDQQPMLQRRYDLASHQPSADWQLGFATAGAGDLQWSTPGQAQAAGAQATKDYQDGKITYQQYMELYEQNEDDPDWATGAVKALGHDGLAALEQQNREAYPPNTADLAALAVAVAAAMSNGVTFPYSGDQKDKGSEDLQLLAPLLQYANFPASLLVTFGNWVTDGYSDAYSDPANVHSVLTALAANPEAAAQWMAQFKATHNGMSLAQYVAQRSDGGLMPPAEAQQFADVITAGTVGAKNIDPKLASANVTDLVQFQAGNPGAHTYGPIQAAYGKIIQGFWPDVMFAIMSTAPGVTEKGLSPDGMPLTPEQWAAFTDEAMRDPATTAKLLWAAQQQRQEWQDLAARQPGQNGGDSYAFQAGLVSGFFDSQALTVHKELGAEWEKNLEASRNKIANYIGEFVDLVVDLAVDPGAAVKTVTVGVTKDALDAAVDAFSDNFKPGKDRQPPDPDYTSWQGPFENQALRDFDDAPNQDLTKNQPLAALVDSAKNYDGGSFVQTGPDGHRQIIDPSQMTPQQLKAYNAWLSSPAVINYLQNGGQGTSFNDGYNSWAVQNSMHDGGN